MNAISTGQFIHILVLVGVLEIIQLILWKSINRTLNDTLYLRWRESLDYIFIAYSGF
jgi:hypothetical protein